jgi:hypothetical protein
LSAKSGAESIMAARATEALERINLSEVLLISMVPPLIQNCMPFDK